MLYNIFLTQFIFGGLFLLATILWHKYITLKRPKTNNFNNYDLVLALNYNTIALIYPMGFLFTVLPISIFILFTTKRSQLLPSLLKVALLTLTINPYAVGVALRQNLSLFIYPN